MDTAVDTGTDAVSGSPDRDVEPGAETDRRRTYTWDDPQVLAEAARTMDGLSFLRAVAAGELPASPIGQTVGFEPGDVESGRVSFVLEPREFHYNPIGSVHGGIYATLLDSACGCAVQSTLPAGVGYTSLDLSVKFLRGITIDTGPVRCTGEVVNAGRRTALARAQMHDANGRLLAEASSSCLIIRP